MLTLDEVLPHFEGSKSKLAEALGISKQAVTQWGDLGASIPIAQELKLRYEMLPGVFEPKSATA